MTCLRKLLVEGEGSYVAMQEVKELGKRCNFLAVGLGTCRPEKVAMEVTVACECMLVEEGICKCRWVEGAYGPVVVEMGFGTGVVIGRRRLGAVEMD